MRDSAPNIMLRRQNVERRALAPVVGVISGDASDAEPMFTQRLCTAIVAYWRAQGIRVEAEPVRVEAGRGQHGSVWAIKSHGIPVRRA